MSDGFEKELDYSNCSTPRGDKMSPSKTNFKLLLPSPNPILSKDKLIQYEYLISYLYSPIIAKT